MWWENYALMKVMKSNHQGFSLYSSKQKGINKSIAFYIDNVEMSQDFLINIKIL